MTPNKAEHRKAAAAAKTKDFYVIIPVRFDSERLHGKALLDIAGKPMLQHVYERACQSSAKKVVVATDSEKIAQAAAKFGAMVCMTSQHHSCGTERIAEATTQLHLDDCEVIVNIQGDEPLISPAIIDQVAKNLLSRINEVSMTTLCEELKTYNELFDANAVKVVCDQQNNALYFSRAPIPYDRKKFVRSEGEKAHLLTPGLHCRHIGIYAYTAGFVRHYSSLSPCALEKIESLEQLRALWYGYKIHVERACAPAGIGVDTIEDLERARAYFQKNF